MNRGLGLGILAALVALLVLAPAALACSRDDTSYFDGFLDDLCLGQPLPANNVELDAAGGLRLQTAGTPVESDTWTTASDFQNGITYQSKLFAPVGVRTLSGATDALLLGDTQVPLARASSNPILSPTAPADANATTPTFLDNDNVDDPAVIKVGDTYKMYYSATAEDGTGPSIFLATSSDGKSWTKQDGDTSTPAVMDPVLTAGDGAAGDFDSRGVFGADVVFDSVGNQYVMYYSGKGDTFGGIGVATSPASGADSGLVWTKQDADSGTTALDPVIAHGKAGSADSFSAQDPSVMKDGATWKMWYTGDDSNRKRVAYATSDDGLDWHKGGKVIAPENTSSANLSEGAFAPTVWKDDSGFQMIFTGRKFVSGTTYQTKLIAASSADGITWTTGNIALNTQNGTFSASNLNSPYVFVDPSNTGSEHFKLYYSGNSVDAQGNFHTRVGLATSASGGGWSRFTGSGSGGSVVDLGQQGTKFDSRLASGPSPTLPTGTQASQKYVGFYWGNRGSDFKPRLGWASSADGLAWNKETGTANPAGSNALLPLGNGNAFDAGGQRDPSAWFESVMGDDYQLYYTALNSSGVASIGHSSAAEDPSTHLPTSWASSTKLTLTASTFDANGMSHPSVIDDGGTWRIYYTGTDSNGNTKIGCATASAASFTSATRCTPTGGAAGDPILSPTASSFDKDGVRDPVVVKDGTTYYMFYTGVEKLQDPGGDPRTVERIGVATSTDGVNFQANKLGIALDPSQSPYSFDETGVEPAGAIVDGGVLHFFYDGVDRTGRTRGGEATWTIAGGAGKLDNGWNTYQLGDPTTTVRDWQQITGSGSGPVEIWVSYLQPYSSTGKELWSDFFPVDAANATAALDFVLTVRGVRWQAREKTPGSNPTLNDLTIDSAPSTFQSSGFALTKDIGAPSGQTLLNWGSLTVTGSTFSPTGGGTPTCTVQVMKADGMTQLKSSGSTTNCNTTIDLSDVSATDNPTLKVRFDLGSDGAATPLIESLKVSYVTNVSAPPQLSLSASPSTIDSGQSSTLSGALMKAGAPVAGATIAITGGAGAANVITDSGGNFSTTVSPTTTTTYTANYTDPATSLKTTTSATVTVNPPKVGLTLTATPAEVIFGQPVTLAGHASSGAPNLAISLLANNSPFTTATTNPTGDYSATNIPQANTVYSASVANAANTPTASVGVHQLVKLTATRKLGTGTFKGTIGPAHPNKDVVIQIKKGSKFVTFAKAKTGATSAFSVKKKLAPCGKFQFRAVTAADADHLDGTSAVALVEKHRVTIKVSVKGRKVTITGKVAPGHKSGTVVIKEIKGKRAVTIGKAKLTKKSTFTFVKTLTKGAHKLRGDMASDKCHFAGSSKVRSIKLR